MPDKISAVYKYSLDELPKGTDGAEAWVPGIGKVTWKGDMGGGAWVDESGKIVKSFNKDTPLAIVIPPNGVYTYYSKFNVANPKVKIYGMTLVNLLGFYGDFEKDSNGDGLADGVSYNWWGSTPTYTLESGIIGNYAQVLSFSSQPDPNYSGSPVGYYITNMGNTFFFSIYMKAINGCSAHLNILRDNFFYGVEEISTNSSSWTKKYTKILTNSSWSNIRGSIWITNVDTSNGTNKAYFDGYAIYDLTNMGELNPVMKQIYGVNNWSDLDEDILAELLPYQSAVSSLGYQIWEDI